jgi:hypothetical protein
MDSTKNKAIVRGNVLIPTLKGHPYSMEVFGENESDAEDGEVDSSGEDNTLHDNQIITDKDKENKRPIINTDKAKDNRNNSFTGILFSSVMLVYNTTLFK